MARTQIDEVAQVGDVPVLCIGSRFLPVPAALLPPLVDPGPGVIDLPVPPGTAAHATAAGRVTHAEGSSVGEVVLRSDDGTRFHYRRLLPSTVTVVEGQSVEAGAVLGLVATAHNGAALGFGIQSSDDSWADAANQLVGLADPAELYLLPPVAGDAGLVARLPSQRRPAQPSRPEATARPPLRRPAPVASEPDESSPVESPADASTTPAPQASPPEERLVDARSATDRLTRRRSRSKVADPAPAAPRRPDIDPAGPPAVESPAPPDEVSDPTPVTPRAGDGADASMPVTADDDRADSEESEGETSEPSDQGDAAAKLVSRRRRPRGGR